LEIGILMTSCLLYRTWLRGCIVNVIH